MAKGAPEKVSTPRTTRVPLATMVLPGLPPGLPLLMKFHSFSWVLATVCLFHSHGTEPCTREAKATRQTTRSLIGFMFSEVNEGNEPKEIRQQSNKEH